MSRKKKLNNNNNSLKQVIEEKPSKESKQEIEEKPSKESKQEILDLHHEVTTGKKTVKPSMSETEYISQLEENVMLLESQIQILLNRIKELEEKDKKPMMDLISQLSEELKKL